MRILFFILFFFLIPISVLATTSGTHRGVLFSYGLEGIELSKDTVGNHEVVLLIGENSEDLKFNNYSNQEKGYLDNSVSVSPGNPDWDDYGYWLLKGKNNGDDFFILGYTINITDPFPFSRYRIFLDPILVLSIFAFSLYMYKRYRLKNTAN